MPVENPTVEDENIDVVVFDELDDKIKRFIDQERTKASQTARANALKSAIDDPDIIRTISERIEAENKKSADEKLSDREKALAIKENRLEAKRALIEKGMPLDEIDDVLAIIVSENAEATMSKVDVFSRYVSDFAEKRVKEGIGLALGSMPKPTMTPPKTKSFSEMSFAERMDLKDANPDKWKAEMAKLERRI